MRVTILKQWRGHKPGGRAEFPDGMANLLIRRGFCEEVKPAKAKRPRRSKPGIHDVDGVMGERGPG